REVVVSEIRHGSSPLSQGHLVVPRDLTPGLHVLRQLSQFAPEGLCSHSRQLARGNSHEQVRRNTGVPHSAHWPAGSISPSWRRSIMTWFRASASGLSVRSAAIASERVNGVLVRWVQARGISSVLLVVLHSPSVTSRQVDGVDPVI